MPYNPLQWPHLREWRMVKFFWTLCSLPVIPRPWMLGAIPHRLKGSYNLDVSHSTEGVCKRLSTRHTSVLMKFQALGNSWKSNASIVHLLGDDAAHRYTLAERTTEAPPPLVTWAQGEVTTFLASNSSVVFEGWGDRRCRDRVLLLTNRTQKHPQSQMLSSCLQTSSSLDVKASLTFLNRFFILMQTVDRHCPQKSICPSGCSFMWTSILVSWNSWFLLLKLPESEGGKERGRAHSYLPSITSVSRIQNSSRVASSHSCSLDLVDGNAGRLSLWLEGCHYEEVAQRTPISSNKCCGVSMKKI